MRIQRHFLLALVGVSLSLLLASTVPAKDLFVDNQLGDDHASGNRETPEGAGNGPTRTIGRALLLADRGDRIVIANRGEPYRECLTLQGKYHSGSELRPFIILGRGAVLDGSVAVDDSEWLPYADDIVRIRPARMAHQTFFLGEEPASRAKLNFSELSHLQPRQWALINGFIYFRVEPNRLLASYEARYAKHPVGITLYDVHDLQIFDLQIRGYQLDGINAHDNVRNTDLTGIDSSFNGRSGISIGGASRVRLIDCSATGNGVAQVRTEGYCRVDIAGGKFDPTTAPAINSREGGKVISDQ